MVVDTMKGNARILHAVARELNTNRRLCAYSPGHAVALAEDLERRQRAQRRDTSDDLGLDPEEI